MDKILWVWGRALEGEPGWWAWTCKGYHWSAVRIGAHNWSVRIQDKARWRELCIAPKLSYAVAYADGVSHAMREVRRART